jgi:hypothetical protein
VHLGGASEESAGTEKLNHIGIEDLAVRVKLRGLFDFRMEEKKKIKEKDLTQRGSAATKRRRRFRSR